MISLLPSGLTKNQRPLRIDELKQALKIQYEADEDTLLSDSKSFPYSDKDVELVCGSLIVVRNGSLQVIHLTIKEYLRSSHSPGKSNFSDLLVDAR